MTLAQDRDRDQPQTQRRELLERAPIEVNEPLIRLAFETLAPVLKRHLDACGPAHPHRIAAPAVIAQRRASGSCTRMPVVPRGESLKASAARDRQTHLDAGQDESTTGWAGAAG